MSRPSGSYKVNVQNRAAGVRPSRRISQRPSNRRPASSTRAKNAMPSPEATGRPPLRAMVARAYGSMSGVPVFGHAVQAPTRIGPNAAAWVTANHVAPSPELAAMIRANSTPSSRRTFGPVHQHLVRRGGSRKNQRSQWIALNGRRGEQESKRAAAPVDRGRMPLTAHALHLPPSLSHLRTED